MCNFIWYDEGKSNVLMEVICNDLRAPEVRESECCLTLITSVENWSAIVIMRFVFCDPEFLLISTEPELISVWKMLLDLIFSCRLPSLFSVPDCVFSSLTWRKLQSFPAISTSHCGEIFLKYWCPGLQSLRVIFKRNSHCVKALSVPTLVVELCEVWEDNVPLTALLMSPGLPQPELRPSVYQRMNMLLCYDGKCGIRD